MKAGRFPALTLLLICEITGMAPWFSASAVAPFLQSHNSISGFQQALLTSSVQAGFATGTLVSALLGLADRLEPRRFFTLASLLAAGLTAALAFVDPASGWTAPLRFGAGACLAGVYPVGMRIVTSWAKKDLGMLVGSLTGAVTLGAATPHLLSAFGGLHWRATLLGAAGCALAAGLLVNLVRLGPRMVMAQRFDLRGAFEPLRNRPLLLADVSYLGHAWNLPGCGHGSAPSWQPVSRRTRLPVATAALQNLSRSLSLPPARLAAPCMAISPTGSAARSSLLAQWR